MSASLDRNVFCSGDVYLDPDAALEIKNIGAYQSKKWDDLEKPPLNVQVQVQHQLAVTGWQVGFVAALIGGNEFRIYRIERDDKFIESLVITLDEFWHLVQTETMPKVDGSDVTRDALIRLGAQEDTGESMVLPPEAVEVDADLVKTLAVIKKYEGAASILKNHLREILGNNTEGTGPGFAYTYKWQDKKEHTVKASRSRVLRRRKLKGGDSNGKG
jgi:predicted phage-related endonuclease